jgi:predicted peptidase
MIKFITRFLSFIISSFLIILPISADSSKIYKDKYQNPINVLNSFLWKDKKGGYIGLSSKIQIKNRNLNNTIHPVSIDTSNIKMALSKLKYKNLETEEVNFIFNNYFIEELSKNVSRGLLMANNSQDVIFKLVHENKEILKNNLLTKSKGIVFVEKNSLNIIFFNIHDCEIKNILKKEKRKFYRRSQLFPKNKNKNCHNNKKEILVTSKNGIYKKKTDSEFYWLIFTPKSLKANTLN